MDSDIVENDIYKLVQEFFGDNTIGVEQYSPLALAYIGDAVYDLIIRTLILKDTNRKVNMLHKMTSSIVKAPSQALLVNSIMNDLDDDEISVFHRGRNAKSNTMAKNASIADYRIATGFEALVGYWYYTKQLKRAISLIKKGLNDNNLL